MTLATGSQHVSVLVQAASTPGDAVIPAPKKAPAPPPIPPPRVAPTASPPKVPESGSKCCCCLRMAQFLLMCVHVRERRCFESNRDLCV